MSRASEPKSAGRKATRGLLIGLPVVVLAIAIGAFLLHWSRSSEANAAMQAIPAPIDGDRAYGYLKTLCAMGPHVAGSETNTRFRQFVADHFKKHGAQIREQTFQAPHPLNV